MNGLVRLEDKSADKTHNSHGDNLSCNKVLNLLPLLKSPLGNSVWLYRVCDIEQSRKQCKFIR